MDPLDLGQLFQLSYVTHGIDVGTDYLTNVLGARRLTRFDDLHSANGAPSAIRNLSHFVLGGMEVELIEPREPWPGSIYLDELPTDSRPVAFHHMGFLSENRNAWKAVLSEAEAQGLAVPVWADTPDVCFAYLDTRPNSGHYTEVVFREPGVGPGGVRAGRS